jgi:hypothetical protein
VLCWSICAERLYLISAKFAQGLSKTVKGNLGTVVRRHAESRGTDGDAVYVTRGPSGTTRPCHHSLVHQARHSRLDLSDSSLTMYALTDNHPKLIGSISLSVCDGLLGALYRFFDV